MKQTHCLLLLLLLSLKSTNSVLGCTVSEPAGLSILPVEAPAAFITVYILLRHLAVPQILLLPQGGGVVNVPRTGAPRVLYKRDARPFGLLLSVLPCLPASSCISLLARSASLSLSPPRPRGGGGKAGIPDVRTTASMGTQAPENYPAEKVQVPPSPCICPPWSCCFAGQASHGARLGFQRNDTDLSLSESEACLSVVHTPAPLFHSF